MDSKEIMINTSEYYMSRAIELAKKGYGYTSPNPMVGCVVVKDGRIISEGFHEKYGGFHAERNALLRCKEDTRGAELYVTLEPCCHYGKTPPCTEIIIEKEIKKVYIGAMDNNPLVATKGVKQLKDAGVAVVTGILQEECRQLNEAFFHYMQEHKPFVAMKYAMTLDGKINCRTGDSKWVTGEASRNYVQHLRKGYSGIMVGIQTVLADDPMLNCRIEEGVDPIRIICDSTLKIPMESQIVKTAKSIKTYVICGTGNRNENEFLEKRKALEEAGVYVHETKGEKVDLEEMMIWLGERKIDSILLEGGATLNGSMLKAGYVNRVYAFIAPKLVGGDLAKSPVGGDGVLKMKDAFNLTNMQMAFFEEDIMITGNVMK